ncbi:MAG: L,D-transpeptidase family protein [Polyangiales bacterium]
MKRFRSMWAAPFAALALLAGCPKDDTQPSPQKPGPAPETPHTQGDHRVDSRPPPLAQPVDFWENGKVSKQVDAATADIHAQVVLDIGESWTPYLFTEQGNAAEDPKPNTYRKTYLALAQERFPKDHHGDRARRDKYLELFGIMPTLKVLRKRFEKVQALSCSANLDYEPLKAFEGYIVYAPGPRAARDASEVAIGDKLVPKLLERWKVDTVDALNADDLSTRERQVVDAWKKSAPRVHAVHAAQQRLRCEGYLEHRGKITPGVLDWGTHEALAEFERRYRVYGWGVIGGETLEALRRPPSENERLAVLRVLTERAMHAAGVIEDGSIPPPKGKEQRSFKGGDGKEHVIPNLEQNLQDALVKGFGLETPESTLAWLDGLGDIAKERLVSFQGPVLPEYYDGNMPLFVEIDRGDIWYEFPYGPDGKERPQPVERRPRTTIFTEYLGQRIPLARFGTTIGGWRTEYVNGVLMWKYKNSPPGEVIWDRITAAPVWLPPETTPPKSLLVRDGHGGWEVNYHETGPSYASAYGLVAAYHKKYRVGADGQYYIGGDEGIRSHGSVDYMSIMRRNSHGCHRLHNHIAVRLMSFVLAHRPHRRVGQQQVVYELPLTYNEQEYTLSLDSGGYVFMLNEPVHVNVLEGRIRGKLTQPIEYPLPKWNDRIGAYIAPDGSAVSVTNDGTMTQVPMPLLPDGGVPVLSSADGLAPPKPVDAGVSDGGVPAPSAHPNPAKPQAAADPGAI